MILRVLMVPTTQTSLWISKNKVCQYYSPSPNIGKHRYSHERQLNAVCERLLRPFLNPS